MNAKLAALVWRMATVRLLRETEGGAGGHIALQLGQLT